MRNKLSVYSTLLNRILEQTNRRGMATGHTIILVRQRECASDESVQTCP